MKTWKQKNIDKKIFKKFVSLGKSPLASAIIATRNIKIDNIEKLRAFIKPNINHLEDSSNIFGITDMAKAIKNNKYESVIIFGDYDVDGIFSTFMLEEILTCCESKSIIPIIPDREKEGYGLNEKSVKKIYKEAPDSVDAIFLLDCGTNSEKEIQEIKKHLGNIDVLIIDHHIVDEKTFSKSAEVIVNYRLSNKSSPYCTAALIYHLARELKKLGVNGFCNLLPYAAIGTIADVSDLDMNNRIIVYKGLQKIRSIENIGMQELIKVCGINTENCDVEDISFKIAPRINANGRMDKAKFALELLHSKDDDEAFEKAIKINNINEKRKKHQKKVFEEALKQIGTDFSGESILVYNKNWKSGVVGIVASKLVETFGVPTLVFGGESGEIKGSGRSVSGINIKEVMDLVPHLFCGYGGHEMAAGASLRDECLDTAANEFEIATSKYKKQKNIKESVIQYDIKLKNKTFKNINNSFCEKIHKFSPFGQGNQNILFRVDNVYCNSVKEWGSGSGGFVDLDGLKIDCFIYGKGVSKISGENLNILFQIEKNFKDNEDWAVVIKEYEIA